MQVKCDTPISLRLCLLCLNLILLSDTHAAKHDDSGVGSYCGYFNVSRNSNFVIYDRVDHNEELADVIKSDLRKKIQYISVKEGCEVIYCAPDLFNSTKQIRFCDRFTSFANVTAYKYLYADTASCSCRQSPPGCNATQCENVVLTDGVCAQFYKESHCSLCRYDEPYIMGANEIVYPTNNSFSVDSFIVQQNCMLEVDSEGIPPAHYKAGSYNSVQLAYAQNRQPARFNCQCYDVSSRGSLSSLGVGLITATLLALVIVAGAVGLKYYRVRRTLLKYSEEAIRRFTEGEYAKNGGIMVNGQRNQGFQNDDVDYARLAHYISMGYVEAMRQPYKNQYEVPREKVTIQEQVRLGEGNFGQVCLGKLEKSPGEVIDVAVKIAKGSTSIIYFVSLLDEIKILTFLGSHPNIVCIEGTCTSNIHQGDALLLLEYCSKDNLKKFFTRNRNSFLEVAAGNELPSAQVDISSQPRYQSWSVTMQIQVPATQLIREWFLRLLKWSYEIANGMEYLSMKNVVHVDLAARNVLLTESLTAKISDFGLSRRIQNVGQYAKIDDDYALPLSWMALESLKSQRFTTESDVWSYGVTIWEIFSLGQEPYEEFPEFGYIELLNYLSQNKRLQKPQHAFDEIYIEMCKCWAQDPSQRPTFHELKQFFSKLIVETENVTSVHDSSH